MKIKDIPKKELKELKQEYQLKFKKYETTLDFDEWLEYKKKETKCGEL